MSDPVFSQSIDALNEAYQRYYAAARTAPLDIDPAMRSIYYAQELQALLQMERDTPEARFSDVFRMYVPC